MIERTFISWFEKQKRPQTFDDFKKENKLKYIMGGKPITDELLFELWKQQELIKKEQIVIDKMKEIEKDFE